MAKRQHPTIVVRSASASHKICKIWFGPDGSYYVTLPYHSANKAIITKATLNYEAGDMHYVSLDDMLEVASLDEGRLKLSHHPDGFCQFSGDGVRSGKDENGNPKGIGVFARELLHVAPGPTFGIVFHGLQDFSPHNTPCETDVVFDAESLPSIPGTNGFRLEGYYLHPRFRRFAYCDNLGLWWINIVHPSAAILRLRTILAPVECEIPGMIGLDLGKITTYSTPSGYALTGPGGNLRDNAKGQNVGDMITAIFPPPTGVAARRDVSYRPGG